MQCINIQEIYCDMILTTKASQDWLVDLLVVTIAKKNKNHKYLSQESRKSNKRQQFPDI